MAHVGTKAKAEMYKKGMNSREARQKLLDLLKEKGIRYGESLRVVLREGTDDEAHLGRDSIGKLTSPEAARASVSNGFTHEQHYAVAADVVNLYENSLKLGERPDKKGYPDVSIHRYGTPLHFGDAAAYITVRGSTEHGKKIYNIKLIEIKRLGGILADDGIPSGEQPTAPSPYTDNIRKLESKVNTQAQK